jgi:glucuronoarabinoxylan endo-1,4-beta-xylanase
MKLIIRSIIGLVMALSFTTSMAQPTVRFDATKTHQRIIGFGGFVCSPQFAYNHMSNADIKCVTRGQARCEHKTDAAW